MLSVNVLKTLTTESHTITQLLTSSPELGTTVQQLSKGDNSMFATLDFLHSCSLGAIIGCQAGGFLLPFCAFIFLCLNLHSEFVTEIITTGKEGSLDSRA